MTKALDEILTDQEFRAICDINQTNDPEFNSLVALSGLDKGVDFRNLNLRYVDIRAADLRGFDLTGADLSFAVFNDATEIDGTTVLPENFYDVAIRSDDPGIVEAMMAVEGASKRGERQQHLRLLIDNFSSVNHINKFLVKKVEGAKSFDEFFDFANFLQGDMSGGLGDAVAASMEKLISRVAKSKASRKKRSTAFIFAAEKIVGELDRSSNPALCDIYEALGEIEEAKVAKTAKKSPFDDHLSVSADDILHAIKVYRNSMQKSFDI